MGDFAFVRTHCFDVQFADKSLCRLWVWKSAFNLDIGGFGWGDAGNYALVRV